MNFSLINNNINKFFKNENNNKSDKENKNKEKKDRPFKKN
jgi:hypothetical protein